MKYYLGERKRQKEERQKKRIKWRERETRNMAVKCKCIRVVLIISLLQIAGPNYMKDRKPMNIRTFLIYYNLAQVIFSTYMFYEVNSSAQSS